MRSPLSQLRRSSPVWPGAIVLQSLRQLGHRRAGAPRDGLEDIAGGGETGFDAGVLRMDAARHHAANARDQIGLLRCIAMMQVEVPTTLTTSPSRHPAPMASQCASNAPTGIGMPARKPELRRPLRA